MRDKIKQMQKRITKQMDLDKDFARQLLSDGKKERALLLLRKKKRMENKMITLDSHLDNLEQMVADIEFAQIEIQLVDGLKVGNEALKELNQLLSIDSIESILEETHEAAAKQKVRPMVKYKCYHMLKCLLTIELKIYSFSTGNKRFAFRRPRK